MGEGSLGMMIIGLCLAQNRISPPISSPMVVQTELKAQDHQQRPSQPSHHLPALWTFAPMGLWRPNSQCSSKHNFPLLEIQLAFWLCVRCFKQ